MLQQMRNQRHKEVSRLPRLILLKKIRLNAILLHPPKRRIRDDNIDPILRRIAL